MGTVNDGMILNFDFAPTFLDYAVVNTLDERPSSSFRSLMQVELAHLNVLPLPDTPGAPQYLRRFPLCPNSAELTAKLDRLQAEASDQPNSSPTSRGKYQKCLSYYYLVLSQLSTNLATDKQP